MRAKALVLRVTADSNIYISALNFGGLPDKLLDLARSGEIQLAVSEAILAEVSRVLRDKFEWSESSILHARAQISDFTERVNPESRIDVVQDDPRDNRILECAETGRSEYLVTGDKHLLKLGQYAATRIVTPVEFLEIHAQAELPG
jgi:putative PIN family toxin of toxin-antitoxin system